MEPTNESQHSSGRNQRKEPENPKSRRGGRRPGAGAPRGNLNALKHGKYSKQFSELGLLVAASPNVRETLLALAGRYDLKRRKAETVAGEVLARILGRAGDIAAGRTKKSLLPDDFGDVIDGMSD